MLLYKDMLPTKQQRKKLCLTCPIAKTADLVGDSVTLLILRDLLKGSHRFNELHLALKGTSTRTLTNKLQYLVEIGLVTRKEYIEKPPRVEYALTTKGKGLRSLIKSMEKYGEEYLS